MNISLNISSVSRSVTGPSSRSWPTSLAARPTPSPDQCWTCTDLRPLVSEPLLVQDKTDCSDLGTFNQSCPAANNDQPTTIKPRRKTMKYPLACALLLSIPGIALAQGSMTEAEKEQIMKLEGAQQDAFLQFDIDNDGKISEMEAQRNQMLHQSFGDLDQDDNAHLSAEEFSEWDPMDSLRDATPEPDDFAANHCRAEPPRPKSSGYWML